MKKIKSLFISLFAMMLAVFSIAPNVAFASNDYLSDDFEYTIRVYSGAQGDFTDGDMIQFTAAPGTIINLNGKLANIVMAPAEDLAGNPVENKYYAKGIRESGKDNNTVEASQGVFRVTRDIDYVVAYGLKGGDVKYTVKFVDDETGKELIPEATYYGNVGEKPVVSFVFIEGYVPKALNLTKTLKEDPSDNVFTFHYTPGDSSAYRFINNGTTYIDEGTTNLGTEQLNGGTNNNNNNAGNTQTAGNGALNDDIIMIDDSNAVANGGNQPAGLLDLDDNSTPLADFGLPYEYSDDAASMLPVNQMPMAYKIGIGVLAAAAATGIGFLIYGIVKKKKREEA